ncbi:MAG: phosphoribosylpyrophosphate synthetase [Ferruginibacter sp.]
MYSYDTVTDAINGLRARGYTIDFNIAFDKIICTDKKYQLNPSDFEIRETYRFEGNTNPSDEDVVYAVRSLDGNVMGIITSAFGMYADTASTDMLNKLSKGPTIRQE